MIKKILGWVILTLLVAYVVFAAIWAHAEAAKNTCKAIDIEIVEGYTTDSVSRKGVMAEIRRYPHKIIGQLIPAVDTRDLENYLKTFPQFEDVVCNINTNGHLHVKVTPMVPEIRIFEDSASYYINKDGKRMDSKASFFVDVPVVSGKFTQGFTPKDVLPVTRFISNDPLLSRLVGMVQVIDHDNIILVPRIHGHVINFGDTNRLEEKRQALVALYKKVIPYKGWEEYDTISVKFRGQVVATRRLKNAALPRNLEFEEPDMEEATLPEIDYIVNQDNE
ncbi:MAG: hypothetical protein J1F16_07600 [Muribaculaceae bacterium]|nr:hypothetical protein [Muribaculaceae bacterium]